MILFRFSLPAPRSLAAIALAMPPLLLAGCIGSSTSSNGAPPVLTAQPHDTSVVVGHDAVFAVAATGAVSYQWVRGTSDTLAGATLAVLTLDSAPLALHNTAYKCVVRNASGTTVSSAATLQVFVAEVAPSLSAHPAGVSVVPGRTATFSVTASGTNLTYRWVRGNSDTLPGQTAATLTLAGVPEYLDSTLYKCVVRNNAGTAVSNSAVLRVDVPRQMLQDTGALVFQYSCWGCHGPEGRGYAGVVPPVANSDFFMADRQRAITIVLGGHSDSIFVNGLWYQGDMSPWTDVLDNIQIAGVLTYLRTVQNDSTVVSCNSQTVDGDGFPVCVKTPRSPAAIATDSVSIREVRLLRESLFPL